MKNFLRVKDKIKLLSDVTGLPVHYASDLEIVGAQLCLLDNQSDEYRAQKLSEFKFYFYDDTNLAAIKDISVQQ